MKRTCIVILLIALLQTAYSQKYAILPTKAGNLWGTWMGRGLDTFTHVRITGTINAWDLITIREKMLAVQHLDLTDARIVTIGDREPTLFDSYPASDVFPEKIFYNEKTQKGKESLVSIILPYSLKEIGDEAFKGCKNLKKVLIHRNVTLIRSGAFSSCTSLEDIELSRNLGYITSKLFENCTSLKQVFIPASVRFIGYSAFDGCTSLEEITLPASLNYIDFNAFNGCTSLKEIILPVSVSRFHDFAFYGTDARITINPYNNFFSISDSIIFDKNKEKLIFCHRKKSGDYVLPETVKIIEDDAFYECDQLKTITIHQDVDSIGDYVFHKSSAQLIISPENKRYVLIEGDSLYDMKMEHNISRSPKFQKPINMSLYY